MFYQKRSGQFRYSAFQEFEAIPGLIHAITNRGAGDGFKAPTGAETGNPIPNGQLLDALGVPKERLFLLDQKHSDRVVAINHEEVISLESRRAQPGDGIILTGPGCFAAVRTADCVPLLALLPRRKMVCLIHAGWRGTCERIAAKGIQRFLEVSSASPKDLLVGVGPCIRKCCYQVGSDVRNRYRSAGHDVENLLSGSRLDLVKANISQLQELGAVQIEDSRLCTACRPDLFYSYRREGATGRLWTIAGFVGGTTGSRQKSAPGLQFDG